MVFVLLNIRKIRYIRGRKKICVGLAGREKKRGTGAMPMSLPIIFVKRVRLVLTQVPLGVVAAEVVLCQGWCAVTS